MSLHRYLLFALAAALLAAPGAVVLAQDEAKEPAEAKAEPKAEAEAAAPAEEQEPDIGPFESVTDNASYAIGANIGTDVGRSFEENKIKPNLKLFVQGLTDGLNGKEMKMTEAQRFAALRALQEEITMQLKAEGEKFLAKNKSAEGIKTTKSGLQYKVIKAGDGETPKPTDHVQCHYRGTLVDGTEFDSSYRRGQPATFPVGGVIPGWVEALQMMKTGDKWRLFIPSDLAYGASPPPRSPIPPHAVLIFDIELLAITDAPQPQAQPQGQPQIDIEALRRQLQQQQQQQQK